MSHAANPDLLNRLKRAQGHLAKIVEMVSAGRDGLAIAQQMQAVIAALDKTKTLLVSNHIEHYEQPHDADRRTAIVGGYCDEQTLHFGDIKTGARATAGVNARLHPVIAHVDMTGTTNHRDQTPNM